MFSCIYVHYIEVFLTVGTEKSVHCSELGGVHYIEVYLQQKLIGGTGPCVQTRGVHYKEVFTKRGFTVYHSYIISLVCDIFCVILFICNRFFIFLFSLILFMCSLYNTILDVKKNTSDLYLLEDILWMIELIFYILYDVDKQNDRSFN